MNNAIIEHYDYLIEIDNDPVRDPVPLQAYMDKWDGQVFLDMLQLDSGKSVLEIGVGTGRLAVRTAPLCRHFSGIDLSPKTVQRAAENLTALRNVVLHCGDFLTFDFDQQFDVIYASLTFMHIRGKQQAICKIADLLQPGGRFILSVDKNREPFIDLGVRKITVFPDNPQDIASYIRSAGLTLSGQSETEFAWIFAADKVS